MNRNPKLLYNWLFGTVMLLSATILQAAPTQAEKAQQQASSGNTYYDQFRNPEAKYRPFRTVVVERRQSQCGRIAPRVTPA